MTEESKAQIVYTIKRHEGLEIRATLDTFKGKPYAGIRTFVKNDAGEFIPTRKGLTIPVDLLGDLAQAVSALVVADRRAQGYVMPGRSPKGGRDGSR